MERITIDFGGDEAAKGSGAAERLLNVAEYVDGPRAGERETFYRDQPPSVIFIARPGVPRGQYVRSVRCADDRLLRYVWTEL